MKNNLTGYNLINLADMVKQLGEDRTKSILLTYCCPMNEDVEYFLKDKAIEFSKQGLAKTHLVFTSFQGEPVLIGYFALSSKTIRIAKKALSKTLQKRINKFAVYSPEHKSYQMSAPLIAQLGKNYNNEYNQLITGDELLKIACEQVTEVHNILGGKIAYLECQDQEDLIEFYSRNGFVNFGKRFLDKEEADRVHGKYYIQMLKYF